jgi:tetraacyldisaccharide 4'-kinase
MVAGETRAAKDDQIVSRADIRGCKVVTFSGVADNTRFVEDVRRLGCDIVATKGFPDHHRYTRSDAEAVLGTFRESGAAFLLTTEKDTARLRHGEAGRILAEAPVLYLRVRVEWVEGEGVLQSAVDRILGAGDGI